MLRALRLRRLAGKKLQNAPQRTQLSQRTLAPDLVPQCEAAYLFRLSLSRSGAHLFAYGGRDQVRKLLHTFEIGAFHHNSGKRLGS